MGLLALSAVSMATAAARHRSSRHAALARRAGDGDLECEAMASLGIMLVFSGMVSEGMEYLDRALASICGGGVYELPVLEGSLKGCAYESNSDILRA